MSSYIASAGFKLFTFAIDESPLLSPHGGERMLSGEDCVSYKHHKAIFVLNGLNRRQTWSFCPKEVDLQEALSLLV